MSDRKLELAEKRKKLEDLRNKKLRDAQKPTPAGNDLISSGTVPAQSVLEVGKTPEEIFIELGIPASTEGAIGASTGTSVDRHGVDSPLRQKKRKPLQVSEMFEVVIAPPPSESYSKEVQTMPVNDDRENQAKDYYVLTYEEPSRDSGVDAQAALAELNRMPHLMATQGRLARQTSRGRARDLVGPDGELLVTTTTSVAETDLEDLAAVNILPQMSEDEKSQVLLSESFSRFFERSSGLLEKALCKPEDFCFRYSQDDLPKVNSDELLTVSHNFYDERWSRRRTVTSVDWSSKYPELLLAAYHAHEEAVHEPEGVCLVWNMKYPNKPSPEYIFHCSSPVTSAVLSPFHPNIVIGGTYSGQLVLWDSRNVFCANPTAALFTSSISRTPTRANRRTPVQRSPLTSSAHTHPVFAVSVVGTQNAHNIISLASDGSMCAWSLEMLTQPRERSKVCEFAAGGLFDLYPTCMAFFANDVNNYAVGAENGNAYCGQRHSSRTAGAEEVTRHVPHKGHHAPITAISTHPSPGAVSFSSLFLTSSLDWTVRLWTTRDYKPLHTFDDYFDYVYDVSWSPVHPAIFAAVDGAGRLDIWNINQDVEVPTARIVLSDGQLAEPATAAAAASGGGSALSRCRWDTAGNHLAVGDDQGRLTVCTVHDSLAQPNSEQWTDFSRSINELKQYDTLDMLEPARTEA